MLIDRRSAAAIVGRLGIVALSILVPPLAAEAQRGARAYRIGFLSAASLPANSPNLEAFRQGLRELGWVEGKNIHIEYRAAEGQFDRLPALARDLVELGVDVIVASPTPAALAAMEATRSVPIVGVSLVDPVALGIVRSLARPEGNLTGVTYSVGADIFGKNFELLSQAVPRIQRVAVLANPAGPSHALTIGNITAAARSLGLNVVLVEARGPGDFDGAFAAMAKERAEALFVVTDPTYIPHRSRLIALTRQYRLPSMFTQRADTEAGGLMSYGPDFRAMYRRGAAFVDRVLRGAKPADLPIEQPTKFEFVVNLKTARVLGVSLPSSLLLRADEVIE